MRYPELVNGVISEDEFHHNYWLIHNQSIYGTFTIAGVKALLDHFLRLYVWFPLFSFRLAGFLVLGVVSIGGWRFWRWIKEAGKRDDPFGFRKDLLLVYFGALSGWTLLTALWLTKLQISSAPLSFWSLGSWFVFGLMGSAALTLWITYRLRQRTKSVEWAIGKLKGPKTLSLIRVISGGVFALAASSLLLPLHDLIDIPPALSAHYVRLVPILAFVLIWAFQTFLFSFLFKPGSAGKDFGLTGLLCLAILLTLLFLKPASYHKYYTELVLRAPGLIYSLAAVSFAFYLAYRDLKSRGYPIGLVLGAAGICGLWIAYHDVDIQMATFARMYVFTSFLSVLWIYLYIFSNKSHTWGFWLLSLAYANSHFFAVPLVLGGYFFDGVKDVREKDFSAAKKIAWFSAGLVAITVVFNLPIMQWLIDLSVGQTESSAGTVAADSLRILRGYLGYLGAPINLTSSLFATDGLLNRISETISRSAPLLIVLFLVSQIFISRDESRWKLLYFGFLVLPLTFIFFGSRAEGGPVREAFNPRYYSTFLGFGFALLLSFFRVVLRASAELQDSAREEGGKLLPPQLVAKVVQVAMTALLFVVGADLVIGLYEDRNLLTIPPENSSSFYSIYNELDENTDRLLLITHTEIAVRNDIPLFYLEYVDGGFDGVYWHYGAELPPHLAKEYFEDFISRPSDGLIVFDWVLSNCSSQEAPNGNWGADVQRVQSVPACVWEIRNAQNYEELCQIAYALDFPPEDSEGFCIPESSQ